MSEFFGDVIHTYTLEQAIEDGYHTDFGFIETAIGRIRIVATTGFMETVNTYQLMHIVLKALKSIRPKRPNWVVFNAEPTEEHTEDEGRTLITSIEGLKKKAYAILDNYGEYYVLTFLLAEEY